MPKNNAKTWSIVSFLIFLAGLACCIIGFSAESGDLIGLGVVGIFLSVTFLICFFVFLSQANRLTRMFNRDGIYAHWQFDPAQQREEAEATFILRKRTNRTLLIVITILFVVIGGIFAFAGFDDIEDAAPFLLIMLGVLAIIYIAALTSPRARYNKMINSAPEVFVGPSGAWAMGVFTMWQAPMTRIERVVFEQIIPVTICVHYRVRQRYGWNTDVCRIPAPIGHEQEAYNAAISIANANNVPFEISSVSSSV